jgi:uncharacterized protein (TIGR02466 family)
MAILKTFPTYLYTGQLPTHTANNLNRELKKEIHKLSEIDQEGRNWSRNHYLGGYSSYSSMTRLHKMSPHFAELEKRLAPAVREYIANLKWDLAGKKIQMTTCWANWMGTGCHHTLHSHPLSVVSGVYYVSTPKLSSPLKIEDPRMPFFMNSPPRRSSAPKTELPFLILPAHAGGYVLFESWVRHEVPPHRGQQPRLSISFNYELTEA